MSDEIILNLSFNNQTVTDLMGNWTLDATPNATYEQIEGRDGYSIVTGSLGRCIVLNAVDQNAVYNEYTVDFDMFVKSTYTSNYYAFKVIYLWSRANPGNEYNGRIGNVLDVRLQIGGSERAGTTDYSPIGRWVHVTLTSGPTEVDNQYCTTVYVDGVKLIDRTDVRTGGVNPFALSQQILLLTRDTEAKLMPNGPGICLNTFKVVAGIHAPDQKPAISLLNLSRVFNNFCTWLKGQLSTVALTGSYNDLSNRPTISTVNDGTLTIQKNGTNVATFTANQSTAATANITVPTAVSELTNDSGYLTSSSNLDASKLTSGTVDIARLPQGALERLVKVANEAARYALTTADVQLGDTVQQLDTGIMYVVTDTDHLDSAAGYTEYTAGTAASVPWSGVTGKPTFAAVATSGAYSDLTGTPTIPTVNNATLTIQRNGTTLDTFTANASVDKTINISTTDDTKIPLAGTNALSGSIVPDTDNSYDLGNSTYGFASFYINKIYLKGSTIFNLVDDNYICVGGATAQANGANLVLNGKNRSTSTGEFKLEARDGTYTRQLIGKPDGTLSWGSKNVAMQEDVIPRSGGAVFTGDYIGRATSTGRMVYCGGTNTNGGACLKLYGKDSSNMPGEVVIQVYDGTNSRNMHLYPSGIFTWDGTYIHPETDSTCRLGASNKRWKEIWCTESSINSSSDERQKQQIKPIDNDLIDAWENVNPIEFKWNDAVAEKGNNARVHTGYIAQNIQQALTENGVNPNDYGLFLYDEWGEEQEEKDEQGNIIKPYRPSGNAYGLRYTEALIVECAYLRKCIKELRSEIEELKSSK